jgi:hypothetical protein
MNIEVQKQSFTQQGRHNGSEMPFIFGKILNLLRRAKSSRNKYEVADIYTIELDLNFDADEDVIDTVFNEEDYYKFVEKLEYFANLYFQHFKEKPSLEEFNNFIQDNEIPLWKDIKAIRFQDLPLNDKKDYLKVKGFFYKKRIQIALFDEAKLTKKTLSNIIDNKKIKNG